jgi:signal transduction histidine kinase
MMMSEVNGRVSGQSGWKHVTLPSDGDVPARYRDLQTLYAISKTILDTLDVKIMMERILDHALELGQFDLGVICLLDSAGKSMEPVASRGYSDPKNVEGHRKKMDAYTTGAGSTQVMADKAVHVVDLSQTDGMRTFKKEGVFTVVAVPLRSHEEVLGVIQLGSRTRRDFLNNDLQLLKAVGGQAGVAVQKARLYEETKKTEAALEKKAAELARSNADLNRSAEEIKLAKDKLEKVNSLLTAQAAELAKSSEDVRARYRELQTLQEISQTILDSLDLKVMMEGILNRTCELGGFDLGLIRLLDSTGEVLEPVASQGYQDPANLDRHAGSSKNKSVARVAGQVIAQQEIKVEDLTATARFSTFRREGVQSVVTVPLRTQGEVLGVIHLGSRTSREFATSDLGTLDAIGRQAGIAIQKARLYEQSKQAQADLAKKAEELARSNTELERFAYVASHDLQEPLRMVASYTQLLARRYKGKLDSEADEFIAFAVDGATRMQALINALLSYSRIGTKGKAFEPVNCNDVFNTALKNLQLAIEQSEAVVTHGPLPTVIGDATQLGQLFQNLIANAIKFRSDDKPPAIHVSTEQNGKECVFSFRDDGIGIDPQFSERIFIIFQRLHSKEEYPGTGIGLALCKKIVERHGGRIWVESEPAKGATFWFTIPTVDFFKEENSNYANT